MGVSLRYRNPRPRICPLLLGSLGVSLGAQSLGDVPLPRGAVVIERAAVPRSVRPDRELLLWMVSPEKHDRGESTWYFPETLDSGGLRSNQLKSELLCALSQGPDLLLAVSSFIVFGSFVDVLQAVFDQPVEQAG